jgi:hypothetical protein
MTTINWLPLFRGKIAVYTENRTKYIHSVGKLQNFWLLKQVVHTVTIWLWTVKSVRNTTSVPGVHASVRWPCCSSCPTPSRTLVTNILASGCHRPPRDGPSYGHLLAPRSLEPLLHARYPAWVTLRQAQRVSSRDDFGGEAPRLHSAAHWAQQPVKYFISILQIACRSKMAVFWVVAPCSLVEVYQRFRGPCCLHHQGDE